MSWLRPVMFFFLLLPFSHGLVTPAYAQFEVLDFQVGEEVEVEDGGEWYRGTVTRIMPGGLSVRVKYVDGRGKEWDWPFSSRKIRKVNNDDVNRPAKEANEAELFPSEPQNVRTWKSAKGDFSTDATLVSRIGDSVRLQKQDGKTITVRVELLCAADVRYVEEEMAKPSAAEVDNTDSASEDENPFQTVDEPPQMTPGRNDTPSKNTDKSPDIDRGRDRPGKSLSVTRDKPRNTSITKPMSSSRSNTNDSDAEPRTQPESLAPWRWIVFASLGSSGLAMFIWGFTNRSLYW